MRTSPSESDWSRRSTSNATTSRVCRRAGHGGAVRRLRVPVLRAGVPDHQADPGRMGDRLRFVFRNFPIPTSHPLAQQAAEAAEAAGGQSKFWKMHDLLYERQQHLTDVDMHTYAAELGIDIGRFDREVAEHLYADCVEEDSMSCVRSGVSGTPTFYIHVSSTTTLTSSTCCSTPWSAPPRTDEIPERGER